MESNPLSMTEEVATDIRRAINALPPAHQVEPQDGELVENARDGYIHLQDWQVHSLSKLLNWFKL